MTPEERSDRLWHFAARVGKVVVRCPTLVWADMWLANWFSGTAGPPNYDEGCAGEKAGRTLLIK